MDRDHYASPELGDIGASQELEDKTREVLAFQDFAQLALDEVGIYDYLLPS